MAPPTRPTRSGARLGKIVRVLPEPVAAPVDAVRKVRARGPDPEATRPSAEITAVLVQNCAAGRRLRLGYRIGRGREPMMEVDPWAVVVRHGRWYLLCWSHSADARRVLRVDRVASVDVLEETFPPPEELDPVEALEEHLAEGWRLRRGGGRRRTPRGGRRMGPPEPRPARGDRRRPHPAGRDHRRAGVVRRAPRGGARAVPRRRAAGAPRRRTRPREAAARARSTESSDRTRDRPASPQASAQGDRSLCSRRQARCTVHQQISLAGWGFPASCCSLSEPGSSVARELGHKSPSRQSEVRHMSGGGIFSGLSGRQGSSAQEMPPLTRPPAPATSPGDQDRVRDPIPFERQAEAAASTTETTEETAATEQAAPNGHGPGAGRAGPRPHRSPDARAARAAAR